MELDLLLKGAVFISCAINCPFFQRRHSFLNKRLTKEKLDLVFDKACFSYI